MLTKLKLCSILSFAIALSCTKKTEHHTVNADMLAAYAFNFGSYWIYKDSVTGELDTFRQVNGLHSGSTQKDKYIQDYTDMVVYVGKNPSKGPFSNFTFTFYDDYCNLAFPDHDNPYEYELGYTPLYTYPIKVGTLPPNDNSFQESKSIGKVVAIFPSYTINGTAYSNVALVNYINSSNGTIRDDWFYFVDKIGLVKLKFNHPQDNFIRTFELTKYYITQ